MKKQLVPFDVLLLLSVMFTAPAKAQPYAAGDYQFELQTLNGTRRYWLHVPLAENNNPRPVVISLHGGGGNALQHRRETNLDAAADQYGFTAVYPNGSGKLNNRLLTWNAGNCCAYSANRNIDDAGFIARLIDQLTQHDNVDKNRVYVIGHSNGGMMAHRLGELLPERIAAIASVAGAHLPLTNSNQRAVPVLHIHSIDDPRALYAGGLGPPFPLIGTRVQHEPVGALLNAWVQRDGCNGTPVEKDFRTFGSQTAKLLVYQGCRNGAEVAHWQLAGAGHSWPGAPSRLERLLGPTPKVIDANTEIWHFVSRFSLE